MSLLLGGLAIASTLFSTGASLLGMKKSKDEQAKINRRIAARERELTTMFDKEYNKGVFDSEYSKATIKKLDEAAEEGATRDASTAAIMGSSDEAVVANKGNRQRSFSNAISSLAQHGDQRRERLFSDHWNRRAGIDSQVIGMHQGNIASNQNLSNNLWNATGSMINLMGTGGTPKADQWISNSLGIGKKKPLDLHEATHGHEAIHGLDQN